MKLYRICMCLSISRIQVLKKLFIHNSLSGITWHCANCIPNVGLNYAVDESSGV